MTGIKLKSKLAIICALLLTLSFTACGGGGSSSTTYTVTATAGANGSISPSGAVSVDDGANQSFTIIADAGYNISDVMVDGMSVGAVASYTFFDVTADHTIEAVFDNEPRTITASSGANGSIDPPGAVTVDNGSDQIFTITPDTDYYVSDVQVDGMSIGAVPSYTFPNVIADHTITASFDTGPRTIMATAGANGTISPSGDFTVDAGTDQEFLITADAANGYFILDVLVDGVSVGAVPSHTIPNITADHTIAASFDAGPRIITASAEANGSIAPSGDVPVDDGTDQTFNITPEIDYYVSDVLVDGTSVGPVTSHTIQNVTAAHTITAIFATGPRTITVITGANGDVVPPGPTESVNPGDDLTFTFTPDGNYDVLDVLVDEVSVGAVPSYTFPNVTADHRIEVSFTTNTISATHGANGIIEPAGDIPVGDGEDQSFTITPNTNYHVSDVKVDGVSEGAITSYPFTNVTADHTIEAIFAHNHIYVTMGDSITAGTGDDDLSDGVGYPPILEDLLNAQGNGIPYTIINEGVGGTESWEGAALVSTLLFDHPESTRFLVQYGTNDAPPGMPVVPSGKGLSPGDPGYPGTFKDNMQQIINAVNNAGKEVCLAKIHIALGDVVDSTPYLDPDNGAKNLVIKDYNEVIDELVNDPLNDITVTPPDFYNYFLADDPVTGNPRYEDQYADNDNLHPNGIGYKSMAQLWFDALTQ